MAQRSFSKRLWYDFLRVVCRVLGVAVFRIRVFGREHIPAGGGVLVVSNHQSHLDPILVGLACDRRLNFVARDTLFRFAPFAWLMMSLDAIPIDREGTGLGGLKESLRRLKDEEMLLIFPEGTRTRDGEVGMLKSGFLALARRAKSPLLPVALDGAFESWPRRNLLPQPAVIQIRFAAPLAPEVMSKMSDEELLSEVNCRIRQSHAMVRESRRRAMGSRGSHPSVDAGC
jgi:1-acyl-sn-glycerol-3-phosphate acyltransferase